MIMGESSDNFGQERFRKLFGCTTWALTGVDRLIDSPDLKLLLSFGFAVDKAVSWDLRLAGYEVVVAAKTFASDELIDNPPPGILCLRLPSFVMGGAINGTPIVLAITEATTESEKLLSCLVNLSAERLALTIPENLSKQGYMVALSRHSPIRIIKGDVPNAIERLPPNFQEIYNG